MSAPAPALAPLPIAQAQKGGAQRRPQAQAWHREAWTIATAPSSGPPEPFSTSSSNATQLLTVLCTHSVFLLPLTLTFHTVVDPGTRDLPSNPTPYGYTVSLLMYVVPVVAGLWSFWRSKMVDFQAMKSIVVAQVIVGTVLDVFLCYNWFKYPNSDATLGIRVPAFNVRELAWEPDYIPIEEFGFYIFACTTTVCLYLWADTSLCKADHRDPGTDVDSTWWWPWTVFMGALWVAGYVYKGAFPAYLTFIALLTSIFMGLTMKTAIQGINWSAMTVSTVLMFYFSMTYEVTLGLAFEWWGYKSGGMIGIFVKAWNDLPFEAALLWQTAMWTAIVGYEFFRALNARTARLRSGFASSTLNEKLNPGV